MAGVSAPWAYRPKLQDPPARPEPQRRLLLRRFTVETDPETGEKRVVSWCPNPDTGQVEREDDPDWRQAPGTLAFPGARMG